MRKLVFVAVLLLGFCAVSAAAEIPQFEVFGGWNFVLPEEYVPVDILNGWEGAFTVNANEYAGVVIDVSGAYTSGLDNEIYLSNVHSFLFGPQIRIPQVHEKFVPFARALFGVTHFDFSEDPDEPIPPRDLNANAENGLTIAVGGGLDYHYSERVALRPAQVDFMSYRLSGEWIHAARVAAGIVIKFGER